VAKWSPSVHGAQDDDGAVQGAVVGVIVPPPDKRVICDKTAQFVARNGPSFLKKIRASDPTGRKFSFLNGDDIYNAYFLKKVKDFQAALGTPSCPHPPFPLVFFCAFRVTAAVRVGVCCSREGRRRGHTEAGGAGCGSGPN